MRSIIILGGNGYLGHEITLQWLARDPHAQFYIVSRSGKGAVSNPRVESVIADTEDPRAVVAALPKDVKFDYVIDLVGDMRNVAQNVRPAKTMLALAEHYDIPTIGYVAGCLGTPRFKRIKRSITYHLSQSRRRVVIIDPTLVYGAGRSDVMMKFVPVLNSLGRVFPDLMPQHVSDVASAFIDDLTERR